MHQKPFPFKEATMNKHDSCPIIKNPTMAGQRNLFPILSSLIFILYSCTNNTEQKQEEIIYNDELVQRIRTAAANVPGPAPTMIGYLKYAESIRKWSDLIEDGSSEPVRMARTSFQINYPDGWIMVDAGMDKTVHHFFEKEGPQPFDQAKADSVRLAVESARLIVITHEHGDHIAGVIRSNDEVARKTILTREQADALIHNPQMPEIALTEEKSGQYIIADFKDILPIAPGMVLIKAPGHTKGEIMIYTRLQNEQEYLLAGDISWTYKGVAEKKQKPESERKRMGKIPT
jgi:glyoxylase-like metal-dependent hydrolase (beta-lactamase superfamily II)